MGLFRKEKNIILALELDSEKVKLALSKEVGKRRHIQALATRQILGSGSASVSRTIKELMHETKISRPRVVVCLPRHSLTMRYMKLPSTDPVELKHIAELQAIKQLPYPKDDIVISHKVLAKSPDGYSKVMLIAAHKNVTNRCLDVLKANGMEPESIAVSTEAIHHYLLLAMQSPEMGKDQTTCLIDIDSSYTEVQVHHNWDVAFSRSLNFGAKTLGDETKRASWLDEVKLTLGTYAREKGSSPVTGVVMTGASWMLKDIDKLVSDEVKAPVKVVYPLEKIKVSKEATSEFERMRPMASFSGVTALALDYEHLDINLLPQPIKVKQKRKLQYRSFIKIAVLAGCLLAVLFVLTLKKIHDKEIYLRLLDKRLSFIQPEADALDRKAKMARMVKEHLKAEGSCLDILREIYALTPVKIFLTKYTYEDGKGLSLKGSSPSMSQVLTYRDALEASEYFEGVQLRYASKRKKKGVDVTDFEIYVPLLR